MPYIDNIAIKSLKTNYSGEELKLRIRRFIREYIINLNQVLRNLELARATTSRFKLDQYYNLIVVVGYIVNKEGRHLTNKKVQKIVKQPLCESLRDVQIFLKIYIYYYIQIKGFAQKVVLLFNLLQKNIIFIQISKAATAIVTLKSYLTIAPALVLINYLKPLRLIVILVDSSKKG